MEELAVAGQPRGELTSMAGSLSSGFGNACSA